MPMNGALGSIGQYLHLGVFSGAPRGSFNSRLRFAEKLQTFLLHEHFLGVVLTGNDGEVTANGLRILLSAWCLHLICPVHR